MVNRLLVPATSLIVLAGCAFVSQQDVADQKALYGIDDTSVDGDDTGDTDDTDDTDTGGCTTVTGYADADGDGFGVGEEVEYCEGDEGFATQDGDCDDDERDAFPTANEICDDIDNDCDGTIDVDAVTATTWYTDADSDTYGDTSTGVDACDPPSAFHVERGGDCNDSEPDIYPGAEELCDEIDNDCDGDTDESPPTWYVDSDGDGYGDPAVTQSQCIPPGSGWASNDDDCNDGSSDVSPDGVEVCNDIDDDCDGAVDDDDTSLTSPLTWYEDNDDDGYGIDGLTTTGCEQPVGYADNTDDCDDTNASITPELQGGCIDGIDCQDIADNHVSPADGLYHVQPAAAEFDVYCEFDGPDGWTLALRSAEDNGDWHYDSAWWTQTSAQNPFDFDLAGTTNAKFRAFWNVPVSRVLVRMNGVDQVANFASESPGLVNMFIPDVPIYATSPAIAGDDYQVNSYWNINFGTDHHETNVCNNFGINADHWDAGSRARIGLQYSEQYPCTHPGTSEGIGLEERNHDDNLGSGKLGWDNENNYFEPALVFISR